MDAGAGGLAVGVHTTQFAIRERGLYETVLAAAAQDRADWTDRPMAMIAGSVRPDGAGWRRGAHRRRAGYHAGLLSLAALSWPRRTN